MNVTTYGIEKESLDGLLSEAADGSTQLPDFQRGWVWAHISHINPAGLAAISNSDTRCSRIAEHSGYHEC